MAGIWKTQHNYEGYTTNMLKKKIPLPVQPSSSEIWSTDLGNNQKNGKEIVCCTTQHATKHTQHHL